MVGLIVLVIPANAGMQRPPWAIEGDDAGWSDIRLLQRASRLHGNGAQKAD
jgi:hypothetical protein